jgi:hypothetical protein
MNMRRYAILWFPMYSTAILTSSFQWQFQLFTLSLRCPESVSELILLLIFDSNYLFSGSCGHPLLCFQISLIDCVLA